MSGTNEVTEALSARVRAARAGLAAPMIAGDAYAIAVAEDELDDAVRLARRHGLDIEATGGGRGVIGMPIPHSGIVTATRTGSTVVYELAGAMWPSCSPPRGGSWPPC